MTSETFWHLLLNHHADGDIIAIEWNHVDDPNDNMESKILLMICTNFFRNKDHSHIQEDANKNETKLLNSNYNVDDGFTLEEIEKLEGRFIEINNKYYSWDKKICKKKFFVCLLPHEGDSIREFKHFPNTKRRV